MSSVQSSVASDDSTKHRKSASLLQIPEGGHSTKPKGISSSKSTDANLSGSDTRPQSLAANTSGDAIHKHNSQSSRLSPMSLGRSASGDSSDERGDHHRSVSEQSGTRENSFERSVSFQESIPEQATKKLESLHASDSSKSFDSAIVAENVQAVVSGKTSQKDKKESRSDKEGKSEKKKSKPWYNMLNPNYKSRSEALKKLFELPADERLIVDYSCALQKDILVHGRLYATQNFFFFYSKIFGWETFLSIKCKDIVSMTKGKTALVIPNALQINTETDKHFLTSFAARDKTYLMLFRIWQNALMGQQISHSELWQLVHSSYGEELGLTSDDDDYIAPSAEDDMKLALTAAPDAIPEKNSVSRANSTEDGAHATTSRPSSALDKAKITPAPCASPAKPPNGTENDLPTDISDSNDTDAELDKPNVTCAEVVHCPTATSHHIGREALNTVYALPIDILFTLLFTNSKFMLDLHMSRKTTDIECSDWQANDQTNQRIRQVTYTLTLPTNSLGPKVSHVTETQVMASFSTPGELYCVDCEASNRSIPYAESFFVSTHWCLTRDTAKHTRLSVWCEVKYKKNVFSFMKGVIDKNAHNGLDNLMSDVNNALLVEVDKIEEKSTRRRRRHGGSKAGQESPGRGALAEYKTEPGKKFVMSKRHTNTAVVAASQSQGSNSPSLMMMLMLGLLVVLTSFLCFRLGSLEDKLTKSVSTPQYFDPNMFKLAANGNQELLDQWMKILQHQEELHSLELQQWRRGVSEAADHLKRAEQSLRQLQVAIPNQRTSKIQALLVQFQKFSSSKSETFQESRAPLDRKPEL